jgi:Zn ribbon nucleic-acid-binding protein
MISRFPHRSRRFRTGDDCPECDGKGTVYVVRCDTAPPKELVACTSCYLFGQKQLANPKMTINPGATHEP